jgi:endonuclease YncB( thermonuclease family)
MRLFIGLALILSTCQPAYGKAGSDNYWIVEVVRVIDGDTLSVNLAMENAEQWSIFAKEIPIRLRGIDAPAVMRYEKCLKEAQLGDEARKMVKQLIREATTVTVKNPRRGNYFRVVGDVYVDGPMGYANIADLLQIAGLAVEWDGRGKKPNWCAAPYPSKK